MVFLCKITKFNSRIRLLPLSLLFLLLFVYFSIYFFNFYLDQSTAVTLTGISNVPDSFNLFYVLFYSIFNE